MFDSRGIANASGILLGLEDAEVAQLVVDLDVCLPFFTMGVSANTEEAR